MNTPRVLSLARLVPTARPVPVRLPRQTPFAAVLGRATDPHAERVALRRLGPEAGAREPASREGTGAMFAPPGSLSSGDAAAAVPEGPHRVSMEDLLPRLVRKVAWSSNAKGGCARLELGAGSLAGAVVLVQSDALGVRVKLTAPPGVDLGPWRDRIAARLAAHGVDDDDVRITT